MSHLTLSTRVTIPPGGDPPCWGFYGFSGLWRHQEQTSPSLPYLWEEGKGGVWMCALNGERSSDAFSKPCPFLGGRATEMNQA